MAAVVFGKIDRLGDFRIGLSNGFAAIDHHGADEFAAALAQLLRDVGEEVAALLYSGERPLMFMFLGAAKRLFDVRDMPFCVVEEGVSGERGVDTHSLLIV